MKISNLNLHSQRNAGHYQFQSDFNDLVIEYTPQTLGIVEAYATYQPLLQDEAIAFMAISKSATTGQIVDADSVRDKTLRGTIDLARTALNHFDGKVHSDAKIVNVIIDQYGNLAPKPYDEETGLITNLIKDLRVKAPAEIVTVGIVPWLIALEAQNETFNTLEKSRNSEEANRTELRMKNVRLEVDAAYRKMVERINALMVVNGEAPYSDFVKMLNARIVRANDAIALSKGRSDKPDTEDATKA